MVAWLLGCLVAMEVCRKVDVDVNVETGADVDVEVETEASNAAPLLLVAYFLHHVIMLTPLVTQ